MQLHLVGGFLGSGKTTAIANAARCLIESGIRVGVVTNDQGKHLVDSAFLRLNQVPVVEVSGGCFCCNYHDLEASLAQLRDNVQPEVVFAESVGSCSDLVATVLKPLLSLRASEFQPKSFSVFTDSRLLHLYLSGIELPFSENVVYLFEKQMEEAEILVINKADLLEEDAVQEVQALAQKRFPGKIIRTQNSTSLADVRQWLDQLDRAGAQPLESLEIEYTRYGDGEAQLAWLDEEVELIVPAGSGKSVVQRLVSAMLMDIQKERAPVGHLKLMVQAEQSYFKVSIPTLLEEDWQAQIPPIPGNRLNILINARIEMDAGLLRELVNRALQRVKTEMQVEVNQVGVSSFHPQFPAPTYRIS